MGWLDGDIRALFATAFSGIYHPATLHQGTGSPIYEGGRIIGYSGAGDTPCRAQVNSADAAMTREKGYEENDVMILILADGLGRVTSDMSITIDREIDELGAEVTYSLQSAYMDPAASYWRCRGREIPGS